MRGTGIPYPPAQAVATEAGPTLSVVVHAFLLGPEDGPVLVTMAGTYSHHWRA